MFKAWPLSQPNKASNKSSKDLILSNILNEHKQQQQSQSTAINPLLNSLNKSLGLVDKLSTNASSSSNNRRQRERTTFDPQEEITRLMQIFKRTHHPTRYQIASICDSLNSLACRKDKKPLEPYNIQYWFKNARAALRRKVKVEKDDETTTAAARKMGY